MKWCLCLRSAASLPHPMTGLTFKQIQLVKESWDKLRLSIIDVGNIASIEFFTSHPEHQTLFKLFQEATLEEAKIRSDFQAQACRLAFTLSALIDSLDDAKVFISLCRRVGVKVRQKGIPEQAVLDLRDVLVKMIEEKKFGKKISSAWNEVLDAVADFVISEEELDFLS